MKVETDTNEVVNSWRAVIKNKRRMVYSFGARADIRLNAIKGRIYRRRIPVETWEIRECYHRATGQYEYLGDWQPISVGEHWGGTDITAFFRRQIEIPPEFAGEPVVFRFYIGGDSLLSVNGVPFQGMDPFRNEVLLALAAQGGECLDIEVEAYVITYALYPHAGSWEAAETLQHALNLNSPLTWRLAAPVNLSERHSFLRCSAPSLTLEAVKQSEDGEHVILRLVERHNRHTCTTLHFDRPVQEAWSCDLMERIETRLIPDGSELLVVLKPHAIITLRVALKRV